MANSNAIEIKARIAGLADLFECFREQQAVQGGKVTTIDKKALRDRLSGLSPELDKYLARDYGIDPYKSKRYSCESGNAGESPAQTPPGLAVSLPP